MQSVPKISPQPGSGDISGEIAVRLAPGHAASLHLLLQEGVDIALPQPMTVRDLLTQHLHIPADYVDRDISTVFLEGHPVDDIDTAEIAAGSTLALSGSLPGICGITMRRHSPIARMRSGIALQDGAAAEGGAGTIRLRAFNFIAKGVAAPVFAAGVQLTASRAHEALASVLTAPDAVHSATAEGSPIAPAALEEHLRQYPDAIIHLTVSA
ncbi:hypothetical protein ACI3L3_04700 [Desulfobaculum sp. SPO524]|uniref:hypothetical protein n=1 Tax=Desulfobaculum sp. SPO524 TaxID=3378071 RepID=UPI003853252E